MLNFVNRTAELEILERWATGNHSALGLVWGRRRVGKTLLLERFAQDRRHLFHTAVGRPLPEELRVLSRAAASVVGGVRDLERRPFLDWDDCLETLADVARSEPLLLVIDEFPELLGVTPELPRLMRAFWDRARTRSRLHILLCGSAVRSMELLQEERSALYGRADLALLVHPFGPQDTAAMLAEVSPAERALIWALLGGIPLYLSWWDQQADVAGNLARLACSPAARLLIEGELVLATEGESGDLGRRTLRAIAAGKTRHNEIADAIRADPTRTLDRLTRLRLVERVVPVTEDPRRTRRRIYRIADNFLAFHLTILDRYRGEIERGLGDTVLPVVLSGLDQHVGPRWEEAFRMHLRRLAAEGRLGADIVAVGGYWRDGQPPVEIDAVVLAGRDRRPVIVGEAKWAREVHAGRVSRILQRKASALPVPLEDLRLAVAARERLLHAADILTVTAADIFGP